MENQRRPLSATEIIATRPFAWTTQTNKFELAVILREDKRFAELARMLFGLAEWRDGKSQFTKDLVPEILARVGRPLTAPELLREMRKLRSVSTSAIVTAIRRAPGVCDCGDGDYGLCSWDEVAHRRAATQSKAI